MVFTLFFLDNMYIGDSFNHRVRKVTASTAIISTYAGTGTSSYSGDGGVATSATLNNPVGVAVDTSGKEYNRGLLRDSLTTSFLQAMCTLEIV